MPPVLSPYDIALPHVGEKYVLGSIVPKNDASYTGPWDCAELGSWAVYQITKKLYGCANNAGDPDGADAYSGFWARDAEKIGTIITIASAAWIPGAILLRVSGHDITGHLVISKGDGSGTVEANSTKYGVILSTLAHRRWDFGILVPGITYTDLEQNKPAFTRWPPAKPGIIYRWTRPLIYSDKVKDIQRALGIGVDGFYGPRTFNTVRSFQRNTGLVADGEVGPQTATKLGVTL